MARTRHTPGRGKQLNLLDQKLDPPIVKAADRYVELIDEEKAVKERREIQARNLAGLMHKAGKDRIRHDGKIISIVMKAEERLIIKADRIKKGDEL